MLISPSVLSADLTRLHDEVNRIADVADLIHLDVMDNHFVPNLTFGLPVVKEILTRSDIRADCHLMIEDPDRWAPEFARAGAFSVTFHIEAARNAAELCVELRALGARAGIALRPGTPLSVLDGLAGYVDMIVVMTVEPGVSGQQFMPDMVSKVRGARAMDLDRATWVQVDGGIGTETISECEIGRAHV